MSGTITPQVLLKAYAAGIFPMAESAEDNALYWVEPDWRGIIPLNGLRISQSLRKTVKRHPFEIRIDSDFAAVIAACAERTSAGPSLAIAISGCCAISNRGATRAALSATTS